MTAQDQFEYSCTLSPETLELAKSELNEDPMTRHIELKTLRDRLLQFPGLMPNTDPKFLIKFLRARKFDQERTFQLLLKYYGNRKKDAEVFTGLKPSNVSHVYSSKISYPHSCRDRLGRQIYLIHPARMETDRYAPIEIFKMEYLNMLKMVEEEENQVRGFVWILDFEGLTMAQAAFLNIDFFRRVSQLLQDSFPARFKNILVVNEPTFIDVMLSLFKPFMNAKLLSRMKHLGTDWKALHEYIDPACLPERYGGTLDEEADAEAWTEVMMQSDKEMEDEGKFGFVDFTMGKDTTKNQQDAITNTAGTFRKLKM